MADQSNYISYLPMLMKCVEASGDKPILELGMGFSTTVLHMLCKQKERVIWSYESDEKWYNQYLTMSSEWHKMVYTKDILGSFTKNIGWGVALIDHRPAKDRRKSAMKLKDHARFIILHDSEPEIDRFYRYSGVYPHFKYVHHDKTVMPNTTVLSNFHDLSFLT